MSWAPESPSRWCPMVLVGRLDSVDVVTVRRRRPVCWRVAAIAESLCSTDWIRSWVSSIRRLFWSRSAPMAGLRFRRGVGWWGVDDEALQRGVACGEEVDAEVA